MPVSEEMIRLFKPYKDVWDGRLIGFIKIILKKIKQAQTAWTRKTSRTTR